MRAAPSSVPDWLFGDVVEAAPKLLGCLLVRGELVSRIVEVEAYRAADDPGCHAFNGRTKRTEIMFGPPGLAYVYFTYGAHWMLNVVAHGDGDAAAILVRAAVPIAGIESMRANRPKSKCDFNLLSGPGKIAAAYSINALDYGKRLFEEESDLRLYPADTEVNNVLIGSRIGLAEGKGELLPWRFADADELAWVSKPTHSLQPA